jgi:hypothetical protein
MSCSRLSSPLAVQDGTSKAPLRSSRGPNTQARRIVGQAVPDLLVPVHRRERGEYIQELLNHLPGLRHQVDQARQAKGA